MSFLDKGGHKRQEVRLRWWDPHATTFKRAAIGLDDRLEELPDVKLPTDFRYPESTPVLFGHYWMQGEPTIMNTAAVALGPRASAYQAKASRRAREALVAGGRLHNLARG